mmetsp:Transcript_8144/g.30161  ORF Transcript_8144/g.30161 Transcript_8144/m.30161 type:complete len:906 (-) Transcript_8144:3252-5969(-)
MDRIIHSSDDEGTPLRVEEFDMELISPTTPEYESAIGVQRRAPTVVQGEQLFTVRRATNEDPLNAEKHSKSEPHLLTKYSPESPSSPNGSPGSGFTTKPDFSSANPIMKLKKKSTSNMSITRVDSFTDDASPIRSHFHEVSPSHQSSTVRVSTKEGKKRQSIGVNKSPKKTIASADRELQEIANVSPAKKAKKLMRICNTVDVTPEHIHNKRLDLSKLARIYEHRSYSRLTNYERKMIRRELLPPVVSVSVAIFWLRMVLSFVSFTATRVINFLYVFYLLGEAIYRIITLNVNSPEFRGLKPLSVYLLTGGGIAVSAFEVLVISMFLMGTLWSIAEISYFRGSSVPYNRSTNLRLYLRRLNFSLLQFSFSTSLIVKIISNTFTHSMNSFKLWTSRLEFTKAKFARGSIVSGLYSTVATIVSLPLFFLPILMSMLVVPALMVLGSLAVLVKTMFIYQFVVRKNISDWGVLEVLLLLGFVNQLSNAGSGGRFPREQFFKFYDDITSNVRSSYNTEVGPRVAAEYAPQRKNDLLYAHKRYTTVCNVCCALNIVCFLPLGWIVVLYRLVVGGIIRFTSDVDVNRVLSSKHFTYSPLMERLSQSLINKKALFITEVLAALYLEILDKEKLETTIKILHFLDLSTFVQYDLDSLPMTDCDNRVVDRHHLSGGVSIKIVKTREIGDNKAEYELQARNHRVMGYIMSDIRLPKGVLPSDVTYDTRASILDDHDVFLPPKSFDYLIARFTTHRKPKLRGSPKRFPGQILSHNTCPVLNVHVQEWSFGNHRVVTLYNHSREYRVCKATISDLKECSVTPIMPDKTIRTAQVGSSRTVMIEPFEELPYAVAILDRQVGHFAVPYRVKLAVEQGISKDHRSLRSIAARSDEGVESEKEGSSQLSIQSVERGELATVA